MKLSKGRKILLIVLSGIVILTSLLIAPVDRTPYQELSHYGVIKARLDSLERVYQKPLQTGSLRIGTSKVSITPPSGAPLAGYGARKPKQMTGILDSTFVRTIVLDNGQTRVAIVSAELLIIHPELTDRFYARMQAEGWSRDHLFLTATHTHSGGGGWAPGFTGQKIAGEFNKETLEWLAGQLARGVIKASENLTTSTVGYNRIAAPEFIKNRLTKSEVTDPDVRVLQFNSQSRTVQLIAYAAHATCFGHTNRELTGDYPAYLMENDSIFRMYMAGAVGSMGPSAGELKQAEMARAIGQGLKDKIGVGAGTSVDNSLVAFRLKLPLRSPQLKISKSWKLRPWAFRRLMGDYSAEISVLKIGNVLVVGTPCDFSGEVALPLYEAAEEAGLHLMITSFNGGYIGYVTKDDWYDLGKYETRTMNWYGPDSGAYFSEVILRLIYILKE
jgi:neutral ceramidase